MRKVLAACSAEDGGQYAALGEMKADVTRRGDCCGCRTAGQHQWQHSAGERQRCRGDGDACIRAGLKTAAAVING